MHDNGQQGSGRGNGRGNTSMEGFERPMMAIGAIFATVMAVLGWRLAIISKFDAPLVVICALASAALICVYVGYLRRKMLLCAGGVVGCAVLFPTQFGMPLMIIGGVIFMLMVALRMFILIENGSAGNGKGK